MSVHHAAEKTAEELRGWHIDPPFASLVFVLILAAWADWIDPAAFVAVLRAVLYMAPIWVPVYLASHFHTIWMDYIRFDYWFSPRRELVLLEVQLPPEVSKSPLSMEVFIASLFNTGQETTFIDRFWKGGFRPVWSLEIASNEGRINYYIHGEKLWQSAVEARIYGQFPEAKVMEVDDYVTKVNFNLEEWDLWGAEYVKPWSKPQALPFKTYIDFGLDKDTDTPETKVDPLTNLLELMNNIGKDEYLWFQLIIKGRNNDQYYGINLKYNTLTDKAKEEIQKIMAGAANRAQSVLKASEVVEGKVNALLTDEEKRQIESMEKSLTKNFFEVGGRIVYVAKKDKFKGITGGYLFRVFQILNGGPGGNSFGAAIGRGMIRFDFPWEDFMDIRKHHIQKLLFFHYKNRAYFYVPYDQQPCYLNTEELATLWHFPTSAVKTPGLNRVPSARAEAPSNLPTAS